MFNCEGDAFGHAAVGFHDGIDSWTIALEGEQSPVLQAFVGQHERAHHRLHSLTPWGLAMLLSGLPGPGGEPALSAWTALVAGCRSTHERYATWMAVSQTHNGLEFLRGNLAYLEYYARAQRLGELVADAGVGGGAAVDVQVVIELLSLAVMAPRWIVETPLGGLRGLGSAGTGAGPGVFETPDGRLERLLELLQGEDGQPGGKPVTAGLAAVLSRDATVLGDRYWDEMCGLLDSAGLQTATASEQRAWSSRLIDDFDAARIASGLPGQRVLLEEAREADRLTSLVDTHQRERLRLNREPLEMRVSTVGEGAVLADYAKLGGDDKPFVVLAWLHEGFLGRHFAADLGGAARGAAAGPAGSPAGAAQPIRLGLLSVDRREEPGHAVLLDLEDRSPAQASAVSTPLLSTLRFTTLRTLEATSDEVDFRGWDPTLVLIDSDVLALLRRTAQDRQGAVWSVIDVSGNRHVDVLIIRRRASPSEVFLLPCSAPTGRMVGAWMNERQAFTQDNSAFEDVRVGVFDLIKVLLATLWTVDLHGWD